MPEGSPADTYTFTIDGKTTGTFSTSGGHFSDSAGSNTETLSTDNNHSGFFGLSSGLFGSAGGTVYAMTVDVTPSTGTDSGPLPFDVVVDGSTYFGSSNTITLTGAGGLNIDRATPTIVYSLNGNDTIDANGMTADVWFVGGAGSDTMISSATGVDTFLYASVSKSGTPNEDFNGSASGTDTIKYFSSTDIIDLAALNGINTFDATELSSNQLVPAHSVAWTYVNGETIVYANVNSSPHSQDSHSGDVLEIILDGHVELSSANFVLAPTPPGTPALTPQSDTGGSHSDDITSDTTPTFTGSGINGDTVTLYDGTKAIGSAVVTGGTYTITAASLSDGTHFVTATQTDPNGDASVASGGLSVTIDTTPPTLTVSGISPDTGSSSSDGITNVSTVTVSGKIDATDHGLIITVVDNGQFVGTATANGSGNWSLSSVDLNPGVNDLTATATDVAGNAGTSNTFVATLDTTPPSSPSTPNLTTASDTGLSDADNITKDNTPTFTGNGTNGDTVTLYDGSTAIGSGTVSNGSYTITASRLSDGTHSITAKETNIAGNTSGPSSALSVTIDTKSPTLTVSGISPDTGSSSKDGITNSQTVTVSGTIDTANVGLTITVKDGSTIVGTANADGNGSWNLGNVSLASGVNNLTATATDAAGNIGTSSTFVATLDTTPPSAPGTPNLTAASDTGKSDTDNVTSDNTPTISGSGINGDTVTLYDGSTAIGSGTVSDGTYSITTSKLSDGTHAIIAKQTNVAGNISGSSSALSVEIDTTPPTVSRTSYNLYTHTLSGSYADTGGSGVVEVDVTDTTRGHSNSGDATLHSGTWTYSNNRLDSNDSLTITATDLAGNQTTITAKAPAGTAGSPINLALANSAATSAGPISVAVSAVPAGWQLNEGTNLGNGAWSVQTNDLSALTVLTAAAFTGAVVLNVTETWANANGTTSTTYVADNVEAYAPGSPIFALAGDDSLTGVGGNDLFVFGQPIGNDTIYNFNAATDKIDLIGFTGIGSFNDISVANVSSGDAVITLAPGETITLHGVDASAISAADFVFNITPAVDNAGTMAISDGAVLPLSGTIDNSGTIAINSSGDQTELQITGNGAVLEGGGQVTLAGDAVILGTTPATTLTNIDNTISGTGQIGAGDGDLTLVNAAHGTIAANVFGATLTLDTGATITNDGVLEATKGGTLQVDDAVTGTGTALIEGGTLVFEAQASANVVFNNGSGAPVYGELIVGNAEQFTGHIIGFAGTAPDATHSDEIDLTGFSETSYSESPSSGNLTLTLRDAEGATAKLTFDNFSGTLNVSTNGTDTFIFDPPATGASSPSVSIGGPGNDNFIFHSGLGADTGVFKSQNGAPEFGHFTAAQIQQWSSFISHDAQDAIVDFVHHGDSVASSAFWHAALHGTSQLH